MKFNSIERFLITSFVMLVSLFLFTRYASNVDETQSIQSPTTTPSSISIEPRESASPEDQAFVNEDGAQPNAEPTAKPSSRKTSQINRLPTEPAIPAPSSSDKFKKVSQSSSPLVESNSFNGRKFGDGAVVGRDIKPGRYWALNCAGWQHFDNARLISKSVRGSQQSLVELQVGETLLSGCKWNYGEPPFSKILPTGKLSMKSQLLPGRYRPVNEFCMSGPTDPRSPDAISEDLSWKKIVIWEQMPITYELVITGEETWLAYGLTSECGGLEKLD